MEHNMILQNLRSKFPLLSRVVAGRPIVYMDNAATTLKPREVIDAVCSFYTNFTSNIHRGAHILSEEASHSFEETRERVAQYLNVEPKSVVFTTGTTDAVQLVSKGLSLNKDTRVMATFAEHHSNILPWMEGNLSLVPVDAYGRIDLNLLEDYANKLRPRIVCVSHVSNVTGYIAPVKEIAEIAHRYGARLFLDAAQSIPHLRVDPGDLGCDYMVFSSHKMLGPSGVGVLWGTEEGLEELGTPRRGGGMVNQVNCDGFEPRELPWRLEAGTPNIEGVIGFGEALNVLLELPADWVDEHLRRLTGLLVEAVVSTPNLRLLGPFESNERISLVSFEVLNPNTKCDQYAKILSDTFGIMTRSGSLCAHPLLSALDSHDAVRASLYIYNTQEEVEYFKEALTKLTYIF